MIPAVIAIGPAPSTHGKQMQRIAGYGLTVFGTVLFGISVLADVLKVGNGTFFGRQQVFGVLAGLLMASVGLVVFRRGD